MKNIRKNSANHMENSNIEENPEIRIENTDTEKNLVGKMENIDTKLNLVKNNDNVVSEKVPEGYMENIDKENNLSIYKENIDIRKNSVINTESFNIKHTDEDSEVISETIRLISSQKKNLASLLQILESSEGIFESTCKYYNSRKGSLASQNQEHSPYVISALMKINTSMAILKSGISVIKATLQSFESLVKSKSINLKSPFTMEARELVLSLEKYECDILDILYILTDIVEVCSLILTDHPALFSFLLNMKAVVEN